MDAADEATKGVPLWVKIACALAIALGTLAGGKRIIKTMGSKVARIQPLQGFTAQTAGTGTLMMTGYFGIPVSTTHAINASILGAGSAWRLTAVRWGVVGNIMAAWVFTLPASALMAALALWAMHLCGSASRVDERGVKAAGSRLHQFFTEARKTARAPTGASMRLALVLTAAVCAAPIHAATVEVDAQIPAYQQRPRRCRASSRPSVRIRWST